MHTDKQDRKIEWDEILSCYKCTGCYSFSKRKEYITHDNDCPVYIRQIEKENKEKFESGITLNQLAEMMGMKNV